MAQVINYHRWPQAETAEIPSYITETHHITMPSLPAKQFDWNNMSNTSIAQLMLYCGQAVQMDYDLAGSGAYGVAAPYALTNVFGYSKSATLVSRDSYYSEQWNQMVYDELQQGHPVLYFGQSPEAGAHAFVVDGYDDGMYHLNWGWEGYCDGYFTLDALNPNLDNGYNYNQEMVINGCPPADAGDINRPKAIVTSIECSERYLERTSSDAVFPTFTVTTTVESDLSTDATLQIGLALYDDNGLVKVLAQDTHYFTPTDSYTSEIQVTIDADLPQGEYRIVTVNRSSDTEEWMIDLGGKYIAVRIAETNMLLQLMPEDYQDFIELGVHTIDGITYRLMSEYKNLRAYVLPYNETGKYAGDIYVPDSVSYLNMMFNVWGALYPISDCPELTSISTPIGLTISRCPKLTNIEYREGIIWASVIIEECPLLESIVYPASCDEVVFPYRCENLSSITIQNIHRVKLAFSSSANWERLLMPSLKDIYLASNFPPIFTKNQFPQPIKDINIHIPQGSMDAYMHSDWKDWTLIEDQPAIPVDVKWDYCGEDITTTSGALVGRGNNDVEFAMRIPTEHIEAYKGCKISAIEYYTCVEVQAERNYHDVEYVFVTTPGTDYIVKQSTKTLRGQWTRIELDQPYTITGEELFVGIGRNKALGLQWAHQDVVEDGMWFRVMGIENYGEIPGEWYKHAEIPDWNHSFPIRAIIEGENLPTDVLIVDVESEITGSDERQMNKQNVAKATLASVEIKATDVQDCNGYFNYTVDSNGKYYAVQSTNSVAQVPMTVSAGTKQQIRLKLRNRTLRTVKQVKIDWDIDGIPQETCIAETGMLTNHEGIVCIDIPNDVVGRYHTVNFNVSEIDGEPDEIPANSQTEFNFYKAATTYFPRKVVVEELVGREYGYSPCHYATIEEMNKRYPDNFIAIDLHSGDEMLPDISYYPFYQIVYYLPSAYINRSYWNDMLWQFGPFDIDEMINRGEAKIETEAEFAPGGKVNVTTNTTFGFSDNGSTEHRIAYVVVEDGVGPYWQRNSFSDPNAVDYPDDYMNWWRHQDYDVEMTFNNVARAIYDYEGIAGQLPENVTEGETYTSEYTLTLHDNVQNAKNLKVVTLLLDARTGEILNADCTAITGTPETMTVTANSYTREYGDENPAFEYTTSNGTVDDEVEIICEATEWSPVGTYPIVVKGVENPFVSYVNGTLTITKAPLQVKAEDAVREEGEENPPFVINYSGWKNDETEAVLIAWPVAVTEATKDSPAGEYPIVVSGGEAQNYELSYTNGVLTVTEATGMYGIFPFKEPVDVYDLLGNKIRHGATSLNGLPKGVYIVNGRKVVVR